MARENKEMKTILSEIGWFISIQCIKIIGHILEIYYEIKCWLKGDK